MPKKPQTDWEKAARALCRFDGHPEDILMNGRPMWMSYLAKATLYAAVIGAIALVSAAKISSPSTPADRPQIVVERVIERQSEKLRDSTSLPYIPTPSPRPK